MMFETFRERLQLVQQDFTAGFKTLGDKSRDTKIRRSRFEENHNFITGLEILNRYEESWFLLHRKTKDCAQAAEVVDGDIVMLSAHWERRRTTLTQLQEQLQTLPTFITDLEAITTNIAHLEGDFEEMESRLGFLESLCTQCEQQTVKQHHINQLEAYRKKKRKELESLEVDLSSEHDQKMAELQQAMHQKQKERQRVYEEAFKQDMDQYLSTGYLQSREPTGGSVCALEQMTVDDISDQEALDDFLNSSWDDDISNGSSLTSGPDQLSSTSESLSRASPTIQPASDRDLEYLETRGVSSEESDEPVVQSDEEDVQPDTSLVGLQDLVPRGSDDSDSAGELLSA